MKKSLGARTILFPTPVLVIGTYDDKGMPDAMVAAWGGICCSQPPCMAISIRRQRHTYIGLTQRKAFTISIPSAAQVREADYVGIYSGSDEDKFAATGLTPVRGEFVDAPYVGEFPLVIECRVIHTIDLGTHTQFIGEVKNVLADEQTLNEKGLPDIQAVDPLIFAPADQKYYRVGGMVADAFSVGRKKE